MGNKSKNLNQNVIQLLTQGFSFRETAKKLNISRDKVTALLRNLKRDYGIDLTPNTMEHLENTQIKMLRRQISDLKGAIRKEKENNLDTRVIRKEILKLADQDPTPPKWIAAPKKGSASVLVPITIWSDWHWCEVVRKEEIHGINEYNLTIARKRANVLVDRTIHLCNLFKADSKYPGVVICLGGDFFSGDIHDELRETNEITSISSILELLGVLKTAIQKMADHFGKVFIPAVAGNHGRTTHKPTYKMRAHTNYDWLLYNLLEKQFEGDNRIQFLIPEGADAYFKVFSHRYLLTHGDNLGVKGGDGIIGVIGPILRGNVKTSLSSSRVGLDYDTLLCGHFHQYTPLSQVIVNGNLKGFDEYAHLRLRAVPEPPQQALWLQHSEHGIIAHLPVYCEPKAVTNTPKDWVIF